MHVSIATIGPNNGSRRVWLEGQMRAGADFEVGQVKYVVLNGSKIKMIHDGRQWWNVEVTAA